MSSDNNNTFRNLQMFDRWFSGQGYGQDVGAFMGFTADADQECFYAYGLLGPALFKRVAPEYEGFYVVKYDKEGNELWRTLYPGDAELKEDRIFTRGAAPLQRYFRFSVLPEGKLEVSMWWHKNNINYRISAAEGKVKKVDAVSQESAAEKFIANRPKIDGEYRGAYETNTTSIAMITNEKERTVDLYFFLKK